MKRAFNQNVIDGAKSQWELIDKFIEKVKKDKNGIVKNIILPTSDCTSGTINEAFMLIVNTVKNGASFEIIEALTVDKLLIEWNDTGKDAAGIILWEAGV